MKREHRLVFLLLSFILLIVVGYGVTGSLAFISRDFWFTSGLLLLILLSLVDQPHFSTDANVFVNAATGWMSLLLVGPADRDWIWFMFLGWVVYLGLSSYALMLLRSEPLRNEPVFIQLTSRINRQIGRPEAIFSAFFLWAVLMQFGPSSRDSIALLMFWAAFTILNLPAVAKTISDIIDQRTERSCSLGIVTGFVAPRVAQVRINDTVGSDIVGRSAIIVAPDGGVAAHATIIDDCILDGRRSGRMAITQKTHKWPSVAGNRRRHLEVSLAQDQVVSPSDCPISVVDAGTDIEYMCFYVDPALSLTEGEVLWATLPDGNRAYYQVVTAKIVQDESGPGNWQQRIRVTASQLGIWNADRCRFEPITWVVPPGEVVHRVNKSAIGDYILPEGSLEVGAVPNSHFPVHVNLEDAVTHNTAVLGVTGSGKSYLVFHLIEGFINKGLKILVLDISRQHYVFLRNMQPEPIKAVKDIRPWIEGEKSIGIHQFADAKSYPERTAQIVEEVFRYYSDNVRLRPGSNEPARLVIVFEEAHSLIPEWNQVADKDDTGHVNRTARVILQGRKYGIGAIVVAQRTANVTKTILNQCNTIFALQSFDQTGLDFLKNYMGESYARTISTLPVRHAILVGKASSSTRPILFRITDFTDRWTDERLEAQSGELAPAGETASEQRE